MDISVIVPVYNVENYIERCLDSIFNQSFSGTFEVIAVDDCSTDNSLQILKNYQKKEKRLIVIKHEFNKKLSIARFTGMNFSKGRYILNLDSDDWLLSDALLNLFNKASETNADVLVFNIMSENDNGKQNLINPIFEELLTNDKLKVQKYFLGSTVNKFIKRELIPNLISGQVGINNSEDLLYSTEILLKSEKIYLVPETYYMYYTNYLSITRTTSANNLIDNLVVVLKELLKIIIINKANAQFIKNIMEYLEKTIIYLIFEANFRLNDKIKYNDELIEFLSKFPIDDKAFISHISKAMKNEYYTIIPVYKYFGIQTLIYNILLGIKNKFKSCN
jgi:glycosyltransferase involved in cell wall biosynthesis